MYKTDYHIHTTFSDGRVLPDEYIKTALEQGLDEIGFADHVLICKDKETWCMAPEDLDDYFHYLTNLRDNTPDIPIKIGVEVDYIEGREKDIEKMLSKYDFDFVIGSVHFVKDMFCIDSNPEIYIGKDFDYLFNLYFETVTKAVETDLFDIVGHFDLIRIFRHKPTFDPAPLYKKFSKCLRNHDVAFEINTNGRNKPVKDFYPDKRFLKTLENDGNKVCVNSDAHYLHRLAQYFDDAYELVKEAGFKEMATFSKRKRKMVRITQEDL